MKSSSSLLTKSIHLYRPNNSFKFHHFNQPHFPNLQNDRKNMFFRVCCKINVPQDKSNKPISQKIVISEGAPSLKENEDGSGEVPPPPPKKPTSSVNRLLKRIPQRVLGVLSNLPLAIGEMFAIAGLMAIGTFIDQGEAPDYYFQKYPEDHPVLGFFTWKWVLTLGFDHMFSSPIFLGTLGLLAASLMACTYTTQIPLVKVARRWNFLKSSEAICKQEFSEKLPRASVQDLGVVLMGAGYEVMCSVHSESSQSLPKLSIQRSMLIDSQWSIMRAERLVSQFYTDLSLFDLNGKEVLRKTISVNNPLRYGGITIYQTDWGLSALQILKDDEGPFNLAMAPLKLNGDKRLYGTFLPVGNDDSQNVKGISMLARDLQSIVLYDQDGKFVGVRRPNSKLPIDIDGIKIEILDAIGSTGLELKTDPGVPVVYAGFGALMLTTCISYLSHAQIWALQDGTTVVVGGKTNRAKGEFPDEMNRLLDRVPELVEKTLNNPSESMSA
ncbi:cytochrome c biogenesis protein CCS1, chloroplastic-like isoform X2 [Chenopodium quinoa]|uniref:cytochrome c biogenesis protein CCS1, chloroplastic-like isoform X2 n=1 Tax=Chenopodium quinoa TaxID=63459 RepID=UPI000B7913B1|nr:cytochrome c biogenesis protein CCS1, chloroplastic-like isoform X2 [Chenopodium quinoa]